MRKYLILICFGIVVMTAASAVTLLFQQNAAVAEQPSTAEDKEADDVKDPQQQAAVAEKPSAADRLKRALVELREIAKMDDDAPNDEAEDEKSENMDNWKAVFKAQAIVEMMAGLPSDNDLEQLLAEGPPTTEQGELDQEKMDELMLHGTFVSLQRLFVTGINSNTKAAQKVIAAIQILRRDLNVKNDDVATAEEEKSADEVVKHHIQIIESSVSGSRPNSIAAARLTEVIQVLKGDGEATTQD